MNNHDYNTLNIPAGTDPADIPKVIRDAGPLGAPGYRRLVDAFGHIWIDADVAEALYEWDAYNSVGSVIVWYDGLIHGFTLHHAERAVAALLASRGKRYRFDIHASESGDDIILQKAEGLRPPPWKIRNELADVNRRLKSAETLDEVQALTKEKAAIVTRLHQPLHYQKPGAPRRYGNKYDWATLEPGVWRIVEADTNERLHSSFYNYRKPRGLKGKLNCVRLKDGRFAVLRTGDPDYAWPIPDLPDEAKEIGIERRPRNLSTDGSRIDDR